MPTHGKKHRKKKVKKHLHRKWLKKTRGQRMRGVQSPTTKDKKKKRRNREKGLVY